MSFVVIAFKSKTTYRSAAFFSVIGAIIDIYIKLVLWRYLYHQDEGMIEYLIMYTVLSNLIAIFYVDNISNKISDKIINGTIAIDLLKPMNFLQSNYMQCLGEMAANLLMKGLPILLIFGSYLWKYSDHIVYQQIVIAAAAVILGHILYMQIFMLIGLMAVVFMENWAFRRIMNDVILFLSGSFIPLSLFPNGLNRWNALFPFRFLFSFPLKLVLEQMDSTLIFYNFVALSIWIVFLGVAVAKMNRWMMVRLVIQGG